MLRKISFGIVFCLAASPALGQTNNDPALAQAKYEEAEKYYKLGEYETALPLYRDSFLLSGEPELLFNIGQCNRQLGRYEEAIKNYKAYLRDVPDSPSKDDVQKLIQEVEAKISQPQTQPTTTSQPLSQPASTPVYVPPALRPPLTLKYLWQNSALVKGGALTASVGLGLGVTSLLLANKAKDNLIINSAQQRRVDTTAKSADLLVLVGAVCVGLGWFQQRYKRSLGPNIALQLDASTTQVMLGLEL